LSTECLELRGSFRDIGRQHGEALREGAEAMCEIRVELSLSRAQRAGRTYALHELYQIAGRHLKYHQRFCPDTYEEFMGIAEGADIPPERLLIGNGFTDFVDVVTIGRSDICECTHISAAPVATSDGLLHLGQTWDMGFAAAEHVICIRRKPRGAPATVGITTAGCLSLIGMNEEGIAIGNTNLISADARPGVMYLATINHALAATSLGVAIERVKTSPRASGHFYYLGGPEGAMCGLETSANESALLRPDATGLLAHTNHYLDIAMRRFEGEGAPTVDSVDRQGRARQLLDASCGALDRAVMHLILSDHSGRNPICRHTSDPDEAGSLAGVIMTPQRREIALRIGNPCTGPLEVFTV
jgi:isopenicillin-N N-acyltransferase-like protein